MQTQITPSSRPAPASGKWAAVDPLEQCRSALHRSAFRVVHPLAEHPLFSLDKLISVAQEAAKRPGDLYMDAGNLTLADTWGSAPPPQLPVAKVIEQIETTNALIILKHVELDPAYKAVLDDYGDFVWRIAGPEGAKFLRSPETLVFITSPHRKTPYHFDAEINFLVQLYGSKDLWVCDPLDRGITPVEEIERYYAVSISAGIYKPFAEERATHFTLDPGEAVHIPTHAAHWVKNRDTVSVSLSLNMEFPNWMQSDVHRANHYLRRLGLSPRPPGSSILIDRAKAAAIDTLRSVKRLVRR
jgi:hypothetical protein